LYPRPYILNLIYHTLYTISHTLYTIPYIPYTIPYIPCLICHTLYAIYHTLYTLPYIPYPIYPPLHNSLYIILRLPYPIPGNTYCKHHLRYHILYFVPKYPTLNILLFQTGCGETIAELLAANSTLQALDLSQNELSDSDCEPLQWALRRNLGLRSLILRNNQITAEGCRLVCQGLTHSSANLEKLDISHNHIKDKGLEAICETLLSQSSLRELHVESCGLTSDGCSRLMDALNENKSLHSLYISNNILGDAACSSIADMLCRNDSLQILYMNMCSISAAGCSGILKIMASENSTLRTLGVCYNKLNALGDQDELRKLITSALANNTDRRVLSWGTS